MIGKLGVGHKEQILGNILLKKYHKTLEKTTCTGASDFPLETTRFQKEG